ncbi:MAG TPA: acyl carrier protein phosphodiesterase [Bacteroidia bacterium]|nr:acyl carrier protein phosphodiesterase [Bacteroidia bacterium]
MNFLAHLYLSGNDENIMIGNFIADHVKGNHFSNYNEGIIKGIKLHRLIDAFTDSNLIVEKSKKRLRPYFHKYSPVIMDVFYDHFLAKNWNEYHSDSLEKYVDNVYSLLKRNESILPEKTKIMITYMIQYNWLKGYATLEGINRALTGMSRRAKFESKMNEATVFLEKDYGLYEKEFEEFFPQLKKYSAIQLTALSD